MVTDVDTPPPPPPPPPAAPEKSVLEKANASVAAAKTGPDITRPFRYTWEFLGGSIGDGLDGMSYWGRTLGTVGLVLGIVVGIATGSLFYAAAFAVGSFLVGAGGGAAFGVLTGGPKAVGRMMRGEKYAEDLLVRQEVRETAPAPRSDYRQAYNAQRQQDALSNRQFIERNSENTRDYDTYWQDRERERHAHRQMHNGGPAY